MAAMLFILSAAARAIDRCQGSSHRVRWLAQAVVAWMLVMLPGLAVATAIATVDTLHLAAPGIDDAPLRVRVFLPADMRAPRPVLYVNDGQDAEDVDLAGALARLEASQPGRAPIAVAIDMPHDRMGAYGLSDRKARRSLPGDTQYGQVGARAHAYAEWVARTLLPAIDARYRTRRDTRGRAVLGWSLGGLNAFDLGWQYPELFGTVGAFSPSFWIAADRSDAASVQRTRIAQAMVAAGPGRRGLRLFLAAGDTEETDDRDGDGTSDVVDDARDLVSALGALGYRTNTGFSTRPSRAADVAFALVAGGTHRQASWQRVLPVFLDWAYGEPPMAAPTQLATHAPMEPALATAGVTGTLRRHAAFASRFVAAREVDVWLPPGYDAAPSQRYPVAYMHDGQNLFDPATAYGGVDWGIDETLTRLIGEGRVRPAIVVGIWNSPARFAEYLPERAVRGDPVASGVEGVVSLPRAALRGDAYLRFLVEELKPFIDRTYRTRPGRDDTVVMGSSMGGLASLYAAARHPEVFGGVGAVSTHWPADDGAPIAWFARHLPDPRTHRLYFDHGTATLDAAYAPYQARMDAALRARGYVEGNTFESGTFEGAAHDETSWRARIAIPLEFLLGR